MKFFFYKKKLSYINVQFSLKTLIYHNNFIQTFIFAQKEWFFARLSSSHQMSLQKIVHQKIIKLSFFSKIWWNDAFIRFDEMTFFSSNLMNRFRQIWWDDVFTHQVRWVALFKFDESLTMNLIKCLVKFNNVSL